MEIWLYFDPNGITQQQWEAVWKECCDVLQCFPVPLALLDSEKKWGAERNVWTTELIQGEGDEISFCIQSDMVSLEFGGRYRLYRNITHYQASEEKRDILWVSEDSIGEHGSKFRIWDNGTGGAPYSLAVLALGILLENRFPENCYMYGFEYSDKHVNNMRTWLSGALKTNILLPICNDQERLWERLLQLYPNIDLVMQRFCKIVKTSKRNYFEFLIAHGYGDALQNELIRQMSYFSSVSQWGVTDWLYPYLEATNDVEQVAILVKRVHEKSGAKEFSLEQLLKTLLDKGITINPIKSEITKEWNDTGDTLVSNIEGFNRLFLRMSGLPNRIDFYISPDKLLEIFGCMEPANGVRFQELIERETRECIEKYQKLEDATNEITEKASNTEYMEHSDIMEKMAQWVKRKYLPFEDYILDEVERQVRTFSKSKENSLKIAQNLGRILKEYEEKHKEPFLILDTREKALEKIAFFSEKNKFALRETTWEEIDNEQNLDILYMLTLYAALGINEKSFWEWRKFIFETPYLWTAMRDVFLEAARTQ